MQLAAIRRAPVALLLILVVSIAWRALVAAEGKESSENPYLARAKSTPQQLLDFLVRMRTKPESLRSRPAFAAAMIDAADRLVAATDDDALRTEALLIKFDTLHEQGLAGDAAADKALLKLAEQYQPSTLAPVAARAQFHLLENEVLKADNLPAGELPPLVAKVQEFFAATAPEERHLRLASAGVRLINRLESDTDAAEAYQKLGTALAKSDDTKVKEYGEKIAVGPKKNKAAEWVGKPMELAGTTLTGDEFDWKSYRGKVVLVDFWATWCGPCVASLPGLKETYEAYHERQFDIVGVSVDKDTDSLEKFAEEHGLPWTTVVDKLTDMALAKKYGIRGIPATFLVDREGKIVAQDLDDEALRDRLDQLLKPAPTADK